MLRILTNPATPYIVLAVIILSAGVFWAGYFAGRDSVKTANLTKTVTVAKEARNARSKVDSYSDPVLDQRLLRWQRD